MMNTMQVQPQPPGNILCQKVFGRRPKGSSGLSMTCDAAEREAHPQPPEEGVRSESGD